MNFYIMTLFPEMVMDGLNTSIIGRAVNKGLLSIEALNIRDYAFNKHHSVDDYPYGGGAGMLMQAEPVYQCYDALARQITERKAKATEEKLASGEKKEMSGEQKRTRVIYLSPQGKTFNQSMAEEFAQEEDLVFLCGHYEGIDERVLEEIVTDYVSIGDYVLTGGELPAMVMMDSISRMVPGVLSNQESGETESFAENLLEYPPTLYQVQYHLLDSPSPHRIPIRKHHIRISFVVPPCKYINTQPILLLYLCCSLTLICINAFSISIIHAGYNMHILLLPVHHRKGKNLLPAPALDLTVFCIFPGLYLM